MQIINLTHSVQSLNKTIVLTMLLEDTGRAETNVTYLALAFHMRIPT